MHNKTKLSLDIAWLPRFAIEDSLRTVVYRNIGQLSLIAGLPPTPAYTRSRILPIPNFANPEIRASTPHAGTSSACTEANLRQFQIFTAIPVHRSSGAIIQSWCRRSRGTMRLSKWDSTVGAYTYSSIIHRARVYMYAHGRMHQYI